MSGGIMEGYKLRLAVIALALLEVFANDKRPRFLTEPPPRLLWPTTRGAQAFCRAAGHPQPTTQWVSAEGQTLLTIPGIRHVLSDGRLIVGARRSLAEAGNGGSLIRCRASNRVGTVLSRPVILQPVDDDVLGHVVRQLTPAKLGGSVVLRCEVSPQVGNVEITWLQSELPLATAFLSGESRWISGASGILLGMDLTQADLQAEYKCMALDILSHPLKLTTDDSSWLESIGVTIVEARTGDTVILPCLIRHLNGRISSWQKQDTNGNWNALPSEIIVRGGSIVIPVARIHHAARYACISQPESTAKSIIKLVIFEPLSVIVTPNPLIISTGTVGYFNCTVYGGRGEEISLSWQHEGRPLHNPQSRLSIGPVRSHQAGFYQCTAHDDTEFAVSGAELVIADRPPRLVSTFSEAVARIGQNIILPCAATGIPPPRILWTLDDRPLPSAPEKYTIHTRSEGIPGNDEGTIVSTLNIQIRSTDDGGKYGCNATNSQGSYVHQARLNIYGPPNIRYLPTVHVIADTDVAIYCPYSGYPIKEVLWKREDGSVVETTVDVGEDRGTLRLNAVRTAAAGSYVCEVRAESGELARRTMRLEVHKPPKIVPFQFPEGLESGGSTQATCSLVSGDKPIRFIWHKDNVPIPATLKVEQRNMDFFSLLIIHDITSAHSGDYTCKASNDFGTVSHTASLIVKEPPTWIWRSQNTTISAGSTLLLPCSAKGQPPPRIIWDYSTDGNTWRHLIWGQAENSASDVGTILLDGTMWLRSVSPEHEGWYRCTARVQHSFLHNSFYLDVREPPRLSRGSGGEIRWVVRGSTARLSCTIRGEPELHVQWTHDLRPLALHGTGGVENREIGSGAMVSEVIIPQAGPEHAGEYRCIARNLYGTGEMVFRLFVKERPSVPEEVRVSEVWSRKARVTWRLPRGAQVTHYTLQYRALKLDLPLGLMESPPPQLLDNWDTPDVINMTLINSDVLQVGSEGPVRAGATVDGLAPDTRYALRMTAFNDVGASQHTAPLHFTTREEAPGGAPRDIIVRALGPRELHITWQPPPLETWHGTLLGYTIRWWEVSDEDKRVNENPGSESGASSDATGTHLRGLKPATRYAITVRAYNAAGNGPPSPTHYRYTLESPPTGAPDGVSCVSGSPTSLRVMWRPPLPDLRGGAITHYTLQYVRYDADPMLPSQEAFLRVQEEETAVPRLSPFAEYSIRVRAHNAAGDGPFSAAIHCTTDEDVPSAPGGVKLIALGERSLRASWLPPPEPNGKLTHYTLFVKDLSGSQEPNTTRVNVCVDADGKNTECMRNLRGLRAGRTYEAWVRASTIVGDGPPSPSVACQTNGLAPARISSFGGVAMGAAGGLLSLRCSVGGAPPPSKRWLRGGMALHTRPPFHLDGEGLLIRGLELSHADNYTCIAENPHGSDSVTWRVVVVRPPAPPALALIEARPRELILELRPAPRTPGHAIPKKYTIHWRLASPEGEWRVQSANLGSVTLDGLRCGSAYRAYGSAGGTPGSELAVRTAGGPPVAPPDARWIKVNATHARLDTTAWTDGGCSPVVMKLEWVGGGVAGTKDVPVGGEVVLNGLVPGSSYRVVARASNEAGWTREVYEFGTGVTNGYAEEVDAPFPATAGELAVLLALCATLSVAALTILTILMRRKRGDGAVARVSTSNTEKTSCGTYRLQPHEAPKLPDPPDVYEISPYATFAGGLGAPSVGSSARAYTLQLRALARHDDDAAPPQHHACCNEETCIDAGDPQRRRRRRRHYCPDQDCSQDSGS